MCTLCCASYLCNSHVPGARNQATAAATASGLVVFSTSTLDAWSTQKPSAPLDAARRNPRRVICSGPSANISNRYGSLVCGRLPASGSSSGGNPRGCVGGATLSAASAPPSVASNANTSDRRNTGAAAERGRQSTEHAPTHEHRHSCAAASGDSAIPDADTSPGRSAIPAAYASLTRGSMLCRNESRRIRT